MERAIGPFRKEKYSTVFKGLILPEIYEELENESMFLIGAVENNVPLGAAVIEIDAGQAVLKSIGVVEDRRREGIGTALLGACVRLLRKGEVQNFYVRVTDRDNDLGKLLESFGMLPSVGQVPSYVTTVGELKQNKLLEGMSNKTIPLHDLPRNSFAVYTSKLFAPHPEAVAVGMFDEECSRIFLENSKPEGMILVSVTDETLTIDWLENTSDNNMVPMYLFKDALSAVVGSFSDEKRVEFSCVLSSTERIADYLLGPGVEKTYSYEWELPEYSFRLFGLTQSEWEKGE